MPSTVQTTGKDTHMAKLSMDEVMDRVNEITGADEQDVEALNAFFDAKGLDKEEIYKLGSECAKADPHHRHAKSSPR